MFPLRDKILYLSFAILTAPCTVFFYTTVRHRETISALAFSVAYRLHALITRVYEYLTFMQVETIVRSLEFHDYIDIQRCACEIDSHA